MFRIRRFNVLKTSTVVAVMYVVIVAVVAVPFLLLVAIAGVSVNGGQAQGAGAVGVVGALLGAVFVALLYGLIGWIFTAIACVVYNVAAGWVGGIEVQVEPVASPAPPPAWMSSTQTPPAPPPSTPTPPTAPPSDPMVRVV
jgi:hypothetical protein